MRKSAKILVIAALVVSALLMTSCSFLCGAKPSGTYVYETSTNNFRSKQVYQFRGNSFEYKAYSELLSDNYNEPWMSMSGTFTVEDDVATLVEKNSGMDIKIKITTTDNWKSFTQEDSDYKFVKKSL